MMFFLGPRSKLEINADFNTTDYTGLYGSGLQFRQLTTATQADNTTPNTYIAPWGKVLTVDVDGKVKLTDDAGTGSYASCAGTIPTLTSNMGLDLAGNNIYYDGQALPSLHFNAKAAIGIGYSCGSTLRGKLSVEEANLSDITKSTCAGYFHNADNSTCTPLSVRGVWGVSDGYQAKPACLFVGTNVGGQFEASNSEGTNYGVVGVAESPGFVNFGGDFVANEALNTNYGVRGTSNWASVPVNIGGLFSGKNADTDNFGVMGITNIGYGSNMNVGVFGSCAISRCTTGTFGVCFDAAGYFDGDVYTTGSQYWVSDLNLKDHIQPIGDAMAVINLLNPKTYTYKQGVNANLNLPVGQHHGLIAQELQQVLPDLVSTIKVPNLPDSSGYIDTTVVNPSYLSVNYIELIPYLIGAAKEQQHTIDSLAAALTVMQQQINNCCSAQGSSGGTHRMSQSVSLEEVTTIVLNQNTPNPFSEETYVDFEIPSTVKKAIIIIYDKIGNVLKSIPVSDRGKGSIHIYAENLSSGTYAYSLVCDGVTIDTKQMVCQK
jgi:hypothetical protein